MNAKHPNSGDFDAGRTGLFPGSCLLRGRHSGYPAAQAIPHTPASAVVAAGVIIPARGGVHRGKVNGHQPETKSPARKQRPMKSNRPPISWWVQSVRRPDGRRVIALSHGPCANLNRSRALNGRCVLLRRAGRRLPIHFAPAAAPIEVKLVARRRQAAAVPGLIHCSCPNPPPAPSGPRSTPHPARSPAPGHSRAT